MPTAGYGSVIPPREGIVASIQGDAAQRRWRQCWARTAAPAMGRFATFFRPRPTAWLADPRSSPRLLSILHTSCCRCERAHMNARPAMEHPGATPYRAGARSPGLPPDSSQSTLLATLSPVFGDAGRARATAEPVVCS